MVLKGGSAAVAGSESGVQRQKLEKFPRNCDSHVLERAELDSGFRFYRRAKEWF